MLKMAEAPEPSSGTPREKTIVLPSGDHVGEKSSVNSPRPAPVVSWVTLRSARSIRKRRYSPRSLANTILVPSGDHVGVRSSAGWSVRLICSPLELATKISPMG